MELTLDAAPCGLLILDDDARIVRLNETLRSWLELAPEARVGAHVNAILSPGARIYYQTHLFPVLKLQGYVEEVYLSMKTANDADLPVLVNAARTERQGAHYNDLVVLPVRRRSRFEDEILQAKKAALEANRAKSRFLSMISHDIRSPLSTIIMTADVLASGASGPVTDVQKGDLDVIKQSGDYVLGLIRDMLNYSRLESGRYRLKLESVAVDDVLTRAETLARESVEAAGLEYRRDVAACSELRLQADPDRLLQIVLNLLTNAAKFTESRGHVSVKCQRRGDWISIHVEDDGIGIPADRLESIFDPFVRVGDGPETDRPGVGLGLSISRELARAMGGDVTVESTLGRGSVFSVELPASRDAGDVRHDAPSRTKG